MLYAECKVSNAEEAANMVANPSIDVTFIVVLFEGEHIQNRDALLEYLMVNRENPTKHRMRRQSLEGVVSFPVRIYPKGAKYTEIADENTGSVPRAEIIEKEIAKETISYEQSAKLEADPNNSALLLEFAQKGLNQMDRSQGGQKVSLAFFAMGMITRWLALNRNADKELINFLRLNFLRAASFVQIYITPELCVRYAELHKDDPSRPETALMYALSSASLVKADEAYKRAIAATKIATAASTNENFKFPINDATEWQAYMLAAEIGIQIARKVPSFTTESGINIKQAVAEHIANGLEVGGPADQFEKLTAALNALNV